MPGTPSFRGCDACKRQKKKCDDLQPACTRCKRLRIECTGRGVLRYRFKHQFVDDPPQARSQQAQPAKQVYLRAAERKPSLKPRPLLPMIKAPPSNQNTQALASFVSILEVTDPRYDLNTMGHWLAELPGRFGTNKALDAAIEAIGASFPCLYKKEVDAGAVTAYNKAMNYVKLSLHDARANVTTECMSAVFLLLIMQEWIGKKHEQDQTHQLGMTFMLRSVRQHKTLTQFERIVRRTLGLCLILETFFHNEIDIKDLADIIVVSEGPRPFTRSDGKAYSSLTMTSLVQIPTLLREPHRYIMHIKQEYEVLEVETPLLRKQLLEAREYSAALLVQGQPQPIPLLRLIDSVRAGYAVALATQIRFGEALLRYYPGELPCLDEEMALLCDRSIELSHLAEDCRPIGGGVARLALAAASVASTDAYQRATILSLMDDYMGDVAEGASWPPLIPVDMAAKTSTSPPSNNDDTKAG